LDRLFDVILQPSRQPPSRAAQRPQQQPRRRGHDEKWKEESDGRLLGANVTARRQQSALRFPSE
jgi:hypothetical protein